MHVISKALDRALAALTSFTRLPWWRLKHDIPPAAYARVVPLWPMAGWVTGGVLAGVFWLSAHIWPLPVALLCAVAARLLLTGAMHEDGLADFADGMGGGRDRDRALAIMKDSHIGTYGVATLALYFLLLVTTATALGSRGVPLTAILFCADPLAKYAASATILLPYARTAAEAKNRLVYERPSWRDFLVGLPFGLLPALLLLPPPLWAAMVAPALVQLFLMWWMRRRLCGYTGDCCGAACVVCELAFLLTLLALVR